LCCDFVYTHICHPLHLQEHKNILSH